MSYLLWELNREEIRKAAPESVGVVLTAAVEQHGSHIPIMTDCLLCQTVAHRAAEQANQKAKVLIAPILAFGNSHHHFPFSGVMSLQSHNFMAAVTDALEGLVKSGFKKLIVLNGHGGNSSPIGVVGQDLVNRLGNPAAVATGDYWNIARERLVDEGPLPSALIPGHAGRFETSLVMALRPDLVNQAALDAMGNEPEGDSGLDVRLPGAMAQVHGEWQSSKGYTDKPAQASAEEGEAMLEIIVEAVADFFVSFHQARWKNL